MVVFAVHAVPRAAQSSRTVNLVEYAKAHQIGSLLRSSWTALGNDERELMHIHSALYLIRYLKFGIYPGVPGQP